MKLILFTNLHNMSFLKSQLHDDFGVEGNNIAVVTKDNINLWNNEITVPSNLQVILLYDNQERIGIESGDVKKLINDDQDICVVFHKTTHENVNTNHIKELQIAIFAGLKIQKLPLASHMPGSIYLEIEKWAKDDGCDSGKLLEIIKKHCPNQKLEAALKFLHESLCDTPASLDVLTEGKFSEEDLGNEKTEGSIRNLYENMEGKKNEQYIEALIKLRDEVLKKAGVE